jgi:hypothetical protein
MSYDESIENSTAPGVISNDPLEAGTSGTPKKRTVREFLNKYRSLGLPGAKKAKRARRLKALTEERDFFKRMIFNSAQLQADANRIIADLINESNFLIGEDDLILWVADDELLENARKYLKQFSEAGLLRQHRPSPASNPTHIESDVSSSLPIVQAYPA